MCLITLRARDKTKCCLSSKNRRAALSEATIPRNLYSRCVATAALRWSKDSVEVPGGEEELVGDSVDVSQ